MERCELERLGTLGTKKNDEISCDQDFVLEAKKEFSHPKLIIGSDLLRALGAKIAFSPYI